MQTKILITGGTGLIGRKLVHFFNEMGIQVHLLSRTKNKLQKDIFYWNPDTNEIDVNCLAGVHAIIHLAGSGIADHRWTPAYKQTILESRVKSTQLLYHTLKTTHHQVKQLISTSAIGYYATNSTENLSEEANIGHSFLAEVCKAWEQEALKFTDLNIEVSIVRVGLVLTREGGMLKSIEIPSKLGLAASFGDGNQMQSWIHIDDLVRMYAFIYQNKLVGIYNGVAPNPVSNSELLNLICKKLKRPFFLPGIPKWFMKIVLGEIVDLLYANQKVSSNKITQKGFEFKYPELNDALTDFYK
jgi:uncharacterized protein (TIGR01777 family)